MSGDERQREGSVDDRRFHIRHFARIVFVTFFALWFAWSCWGVLYVNSENRHGCERLAGTRDVVYQVLTGAERSLGQQAAVAGSPQQRKILLQRQRQYRGYLAQLEQQVTPYRADDPTGPMDIDCQKAYPLPAPLSLFE